jgi:hypothetical protein
MSESGTALSHNPATMSTFGLLNDEKLEQLTVPVVIGRGATGLPPLWNPYIVTADIRRGGRQSRGDSRDTGTETDIRRLERRFRCP